MAGMHEPVVEMPASGDAASKTVPTYEASNVVLYDEKGEVSGLGRTTALNKGLTVGMFCESREKKSDNATRREQHYRITDIRMDGSIEITGITYKVVVVMQSAIRIFQPFVP